MIEIFSRKTSPQSTKYSREMNGKTSIMIANPMAAID